MIFHANDAKHHSSSSRYNSIIEMAFMEWMNKSFRIPQASNRTIRYRLHSPCNRQSKAKHFRWANGSAVCVYMIPCTASIHTFLITSFNGVPTDFKTASVNVNSGTIGISVSDAVGLTVSDVVDLSFLLLFSLPPPTRPFGRTRNCSMKTLCQNRRTRK